MKYKFIKAHRDQYPVSVMCRVVAVARSGYYEWLKQPLSVRKMADQLLLMHIRDIFAESRNTYGSCRIHPILTKQGLPCGGASDAARQTLAYNGPALQGCDHR